MILYWKAIFGILWASGKEKMIPQDYSAIPISSDGDLRRRSLFIDTQTPCSFCSLLIENYDWYEKSIEHNSAKNLLWNLSWHGTLRFIRRVLAVPNLSFQKTPTVADTIKVWVLFWLLGKDTILNGRCREILIFARYFAPFRLNTGDVNHARHGE